MHKILFSILALLIFSTLHSQSYERKWGSMLSIYDQPEKPFSPIRKIFSNPLVAEVNPSSGKIYVVSGNVDEIVEHNEKNAKRKVIYKIPGNSTSSVIEQIKFDSNNNLIIAGKTSNPDLATPNAYSEELIPTLSAGYSFIAKLNDKGKVIWFTYFHEIPYGTVALTVDKEDNIYILNKRFRGDVLDSSSFQNKGDGLSKYDFQDAISKFNKDGKHFWSTFYSKDDSIINAIVSANNGLYVYGIHISSRPSSNYFSTTGSFLESSSTDNKNTSLVFLTKFNFDGTRKWSSYFGNKKSFVPTTINNIIKSPNYLTTIGDDAYFISYHNHSLSRTHANLATQNAFISSPPSSNENYTLTKFSGIGDREWTTYLNNYGIIYKSMKNDELFISTTINSTDKKINFLTDLNSYQMKHGGMQDIYTYTLSLNGEIKKYSTFYGFEGNDAGFSLPSLNGFYTIGFANIYNYENSLFVTKKAPFKKFKQHDSGSYLGNFIGFFIK